MTSPQIRTHVEQAAARISALTSYQPTVGLILGSGLHAVAEAVQSPDMIPAEAVPHWPASTAPGHTGRLVLGQLEERPALVVQGRVHLYEGYEPDEITLPVRVMHALGVTTLIVTNAAGAINPGYTPGEMMLIRDHVNMPGLAGNNPLRGPNDDSIGPRFPDMIGAYDPELRQLAHRVAKELGFSLREGVYAYVGGPSFETPAELHFLRSVGADAVGMSTVPSVVVARHAGMRVLGISTLTNMAIPDPEPGAELSHDEVMEIGRAVIPALTSLILGVVRHL